MLFSVPGARSSPGRPATVTSPGFTGCLNCWWLPRVRARYQPSSARSRRTSRIFITVKMDAEPARQQGLARPTFSPGIPPPDPVQNHANSSPLRALRGCACGPVQPGEARADHPSLRSGQACRPLHPVHPVRPSALPARPPCPPARPVRLPACQAPTRSTVPGRTAASAR